MKTWHFSVCSMLFSTLFTLPAVWMEAWAVDASTLNYQLAPRQIAEGVWVIEGKVEDFSEKNGCNIINTGFVMSPEGSLIINTGPSNIYGEQQRMAVKKVGVRAIARVVNLNLHPDYFFGNQAWRDSPLAALAGSQRGMWSEGGAYEDNMYRLCGPWMRGTKMLLPEEAIKPGRFAFGGHALEWVELRGHTANDLVLIDDTAQVLFAGGLVFADRVPTMPHANLQQWQESLLQIRTWITQGRVRTVVPSHGPVHQGSYGVDQTLDWLSWLDSQLKASADQGLDVLEVLALPIPERFRQWAVLQDEFARNVMTLYPAYEYASLSARATRAARAE